MAGINKILFLGNLTRDPELRYTQGGTAVCEFGLAVSRRYQTSGGEAREETCFIDGMVYGKRGEAFSRYFTKGRKVFVEGRLQFDQWQTPEGQRRSRHRIVVEDWQFVDAPASSRSGTPARREPLAPRAEEGPAAGPEPVPQEEPVAEGPLDEDADTPF